MLFLNRKTEFRRIVFILAFVTIFCCSCAPKEEQSVNGMLEEAATETNEIIEEPQSYEEPQVEIIMVGDVLLHDNVQESGKLDDGTYNYDHLFANITEDVQAADIAIANQEVILGGTELGLHGYPNFNGPYEVADALEKAGFNVILHATNHALDHGKTALMNCMNYWKSQHSDVAVLGIFDSQEAGQFYQFYQ